jgi:hypothetical protein
MAANCCKKMNDNETCNKVISSMDWSASKDEFQICIASLQGDIDKIIILLPAVAANGSINANQFREWPAFDWVRDDAKVNEAFERVYGETMRSRAPEAITNTKTNISTDADGEFGAVSLVTDDATPHRGTA